MRRMRWVVAILLCVTLVLAGCGKKKEAKDVIKDLEQVLDKMNSYQASGSMLLYTGEQPLEYEVEVWYQNPHFYRIALTNANKDITQIVLKNDEGVFILTPHLNKSIRFQSEWPDHNGQVYLYQTLLKSIIKDNERLFTIDDGDAAYVFDVVASYDNSSLARQKIWLNHKTYAPEHVEIVDDQKNVMVVVEFEHFSFDKAFDNESFDKQWNLTSWNLSTWPVFASGSDDDDMMSDSADLQEGSAHLGIIFPSYIPEGVVHAETKKIVLGDEAAVLLTYEGDYNYSIVEMQPQSQEVSILPGSIVDVVDMHFAVGMMTGTDNKMLRWIYDGTEFRLAAGDLPQSEMVKIAQSVQGQSGK